MGISTNQRSNQKYLKCMKLTFKRLIMKKLLLSTAILLVTVSGHAQENPFAEYGYTPKIATLIQGKFNESFDNDTIVQIGSVLFNTKSKQIVAFVEYDTLYSEATLEPDIVSRWLSPDPLAANYTSLSPYHFANNNPIYNVEIDGRYFLSHSQRHGGNYVMHITNHNWVEKVTYMSAIPYLGLIFEASLWGARDQDPSFKATKADYVGIGFQAYGAGSLKLMSKLGKVNGLGKIALETSREFNSNLMSLMSEPGTQEVAIDYLAAKSLESEGVGKFYENKNGEEMTSKFFFNKDFIENIESDIMKNDELTSKKDFNLSTEVQSRLTQIMDNKKEEIQTAISDED